MKTFSEFNNINENHNFTNEADTGLKGVKTFKNGLSVEIIKERYPWLLKAKFKNAVIGRDLDRLNVERLVWYDGTWIDGTWEKGTWLDGVWENGTWGNGSWKKGTWKNGEWEAGIWYDGTWESGTWQYGSWENGTWKKGTWKNGEWLDGTWENGTWKKGFILNEKTRRIEKSDEPPTEK